MHCCAGWQCACAFPDGGGDFCHSAPACQHHQGSAAEPCVPHRCNPSCIPWRLHDWGPQSAQHADSGLPEKEARGIYSGSLGYIGLNDTCDLNIVIRTAVVHGGRTRIGAGGAIVVQSDTQGEYEEMRLKAMALLKAVSMSEGGGPPGSSQQG